MYVWPSTHVYSCTCMYMYVRDRKDTKARQYTFTDTCMHMYMYYIHIYMWRLLCILVCFIACDSSFFLLCSLLSLIVVHYARDCSCMYMYDIHVYTCTCTCRLCRCGLHSFPTPSLIFWLSLDQILQATHCTPLFRLASLLCSLSSFSALASFI